MARPRNKNSKTSFMHLGLESAEEEKFQRMLKERDISARQVLRTMIRKWVREENYTTK